MPKSSLDENTLATLVDAGTVKTVTVRADGGAWYIEAQVGMESKVLGSKRQPVRFWRDLDTVARRLLDLGIVKWDVDAKHYSPGQTHLA